MSACLGPHVSVRPSLECSGHGSCLISNTSSGEELARCVCEPGWTGASHWVTADGMDCHLNAVAIRVLWAALLALVLGIQIFYFRPFWKTLRKFQAMQTVKISKFRRPRKLTDHTTLFTLLIYFCITSPIIVTLCIIMLVWPTTMHIAEDWGPTLLWWFGRSTFYICSSLYQPALISTLVKKHAPGAQNVLSEKWFSTWSLTTGHVVLGSLAFVSLGVGTRAGAVGTWSVCMGGTGVILCILALQAIHLKNTLIIQLDDAYQYLRTSEIKQTKERMESVQNHVFVHAILQMLIYFAFAAVPHLRTYYDYLLPVSWFTIPATARVVVRTLMIEQLKGQREGLQTIISNGVKEQRGLSETELTRGTVISISRVEDGRLLAVGDEFRGSFRNRASYPYYADQSVSEEGGSTWSGHDTGKVDTVAPESSEGDGDALQSDDADGENDDADNDDDDDEEEEEDIIPRQLGSSSFVARRL